MNKNLSYIEISRSSLIGNIESFKSFLGNKVKIAAVIKANAYGHGQNEIAEILESYVEYFQVDDLQELQLLRKITKKPVLVFGYVSKSEIEKVLKLKGIITIYDVERLKLISKIALRLKIIPKIHIKIDADFGRQGLLLEDINDFIIEAKKIKNIIFDGIYSHFSNIKNIKINKHALKQTDTFLKAVELFKQNGFNNLTTHISATYGSLVYEKNVLHNKLVRIGIGIYGMWSFPELENNFNHTVKIKPVMRWVSHIAQVKTLPKNHTIGYGLTYKTNRSTDIAVIPQGFCDGYDRGFSNCGEVLIKGKRCRVLGRVSMNMFVVDITGVKNVKPEDEVVLLGLQENERITAEEIAEKIDTINEEITTRVSSLLPRIVV
jgi:alanine racemase